MTDKDYKQISIFIVLYMFFRIAPELFNIADDGIFIAIFEALSGVVSIIALILVAIQIKNSNDQLGLIKDQDKRNQQAIIRLKVLGQKASDIHFEVYNIGLSSSFDVNILIEGEDNNGVKKTIRNVFVSDKDVTNIYKKSYLFKDEIILSGEKIHGQFSLSESKDINKVTYKITFKDNASESVNEFIKGL